jgi:hypothetical protein
MHLTNMQKRRETNNFNLYNKKINNYYWSTFLFKLFASVKLTEKKLVIVHFVNYV